MDVEAAEPERYLSSPKESSCPIHRSPSSSPPGKSLRSDQDRVQAERDRRRR